MVLSKNVSISSVILIPPHSLLSAAPLGGLGDTDLEFMFGQCGKKPSRLLSFWMGARWSEIKTGVVEAKLVKTDRHSDAV